MPGGFGVVPDVYGVLPGDIGVVPGVHAALPGDTGLSLVLMRFCKVMLGL